MTSEIIQEYREKLNPVLEDYAKREGLFQESTRSVQCPVCGGYIYRQDIRDPLHWKCLRCGESGDTVDLAMLCYPHYSEWEAIRHIHKMMGMKITELDSVSAGELVQMQLKPRTYLVENLLGQGLYLLVGPGKIGKSWMVLYMADRISKGKPVWGMPSRQCEVLYVSLEDTLERLQSRLIAITGGEVGPVHLATEAELLGEGFEEQISNFLNAHPKVKLVIVDTLQKIRQLGRENYSYAGDYATMSKLKGLADRHGITVLLVHHTRKMQSDDPMDRISGTNGIGGAADGMLVLQKRSRIGSEAVLTLTGRDMADQELKLDFDREAKLWRLLEGGEKTPEQERTERMVLSCKSLLEQNGGCWEGTASELLSLLGREEEMTPMALGIRLRNAEAALRDQGICVENARSNSKRTLRLRTLP